LVNTDFFLSIKLKKIIAIVFIFSVIFEVLLYFMIYDVGQFGMSTNVSRILQLVTILLLSTYLLLNKFKFRIAKGCDYIISRYSIFLAFCILSGFYGYIYGVWDLDIQISKSRVLIEYIMTLYSFVYFILLPIFILRDNKTIKLFFESMNILFSISFFIGIASLFSKYFFDYALISRHFSGFVDVGFRFHGLFGEPRDAGPGLVLWISLIYLGSYHSKAKEPNKLMISFILIAIIFTFSMSAIVGIFLSLVMILIYKIKLSSSNVMQIFKYLFSAFLLVSIIFTVISLSDRLSMYKESIGQTYSQFEQDEKIDTILKSQMVDVYPVLHRIREVRDLEIFPLLVGTGLGSSSLINKKYRDTGDMIKNPRSNLTRYFFDTGLLGLMAYIWFFILVTNKMLIYFSFKNQEHIMVLLLANLGMSLAHRSVSVFVFTGILLVVGFYRKNNLQ
jgi:hypothetical protein